VQIAPVLECLDLIDQTFFNHGLKPELDSLDQPFPILRSNQHGDQIKILGRGRILRDYFGHGSPCELVNLQGSLDALGIIRMDSLGGDGIDGPEPLMKKRPSVFLGLCIQGFANAGVRKGQG